MKNNSQFSTLHFQLSPVPPDYKQTEVGIIPEEWEVESCGKLCVKIQDGTHFSPKIRGNDYLYVTSKNVRFGYLDVSTADRIDAVQHEAIYKRCDVKYGDLLLTKDGANTGNAALNTLTEQFSLLSSVALLRFDPKQHSTAYFLQQCLSAEGQQRMKDAMSGNAITRLTLEKIRKLRFPVAPRPEQRAIATALSDVDGLIESLEKLIGKKRDLKQAAMQMLLTGKKRLTKKSGSAAPQLGSLRDKAELGLGVPRGWTVKRLGDVARIQRGASPRPIDSPVWFDENSLIGWVRISDVTRSGMFLQETTQRLSPLGVQYSRPVAKGSLIMSICATVGRPVITEIDVCIHDGFVVFDSLQADQRFLYYVLKWIEPDWSKNGQTGSQMNLNTGLINGIRIFLPPLPEQTAIAEILSDMDAEIQGLETKLSKTRLLKQGMMQELLTGRIRLT